jgi:PAS domain S-box-containing protein
MTSPAPARPRGLIARARLWAGESLEHRLALFTVLLSLVVLIPAAGLSLAYSSRLVRRDFEARRLAQAHLGASRLQLALQSAHVELSGLAGSALVATALVDASGWRLYALPFLEGHQLALGVPSRIALCDFKGRIIAAGHDRPSLEPLEWVGAVIDRGEPTALIQSPGPRAELLVVEPVRYPGTRTVEGALAAEIPLAPLVQKAFADLPSTRLRAGDGQLLFGPAPATAEDTSQSALELGGTPFAPLAFAVETGQPSSQLGARLALLVALHVVAAAALLAAGLLIAHRLARGSTARLSELAATAWEISTTGALTTRVTISGHDETARLAAAFNEMLGQLERAHEQAETAHRDQAREARGALRLAYGALERSSEAISIFESSGNIAYANEAACTQLGRPREQVVGHPAWAVDPSFGEDTWGALWDQLRAQGRSIGERPVGGPGVDATWLEVSTSRLELEGCEYGVSITRDVTARRQAEAALRLAGVGTLAAGAAHEINNPLTGVMGNLAFLKSDLATIRETIPPEHAAELSEALQAATEAYQGAERVRDVVRSLKAFSRPDAERQEPTDVALALQGALTLARNELRHRARLEERYEPAPKVLASSRRLEQVFLNLLVNATQSLGDGPVEAHLVTVEVRPGPGLTVVAEVRDTGVGMSPEVRARIFEPFFTTKPVGAGTGLGLAICHGIISSYGGHFEVESEPGRGTTMRVVLPALVEPGAEAGGPVGAGPAPRIPLPFGARILLVDDDPIITRVVQRTLAGGPEIVCLEDPRAALTRLCGGERFDLILCDLMMPRLSGQDLYAELCRNRPELADRVIFVTGGAFTPRSQAFLTKSGVTCLEKPFDPDVLRRLVAERLATTTLG